MEKKLTNLPTLRYNFYPRRMLNEQPFVSPEALSTVPIIVFLRFASHYRKLDGYGKTDPEHK